MDSQTEETLLREFELAAGAVFGQAAQATAPTGTQEVADDAAEVLRTVKAASEAQTEAAAASVEAAREVWQVTPPAPPAGLPAASQPPATAVSAAASSGGTGAVDILKTVLTSGLGVGPLVTGLLQLFGGSDAPPPAPVKYVPPAPVRFEMANTESGMTNVDYGQGGTPRAYAAEAGGAAPQIHINVQAMDSRSFLDHSEEIAQAVREAMLNMHPINDVIADL